MLTALHTPSLLHFATHCAVPHSAVNTRCPLYAALCHAVRHTTVRLLLSAALILYIAYCRSRTYFSLPVSAGYSQNVLLPFLIGMFWHNGSLDDRGFVGRQTTMCCGHVTICIHVIHPQGQGRKATYYISGGVLKGEGAAHVWIALRGLIFEDQTAGNKNVCARKVLQPAKSKLYCGFPVARPILNSYTKPTLHYIFIMQPTFTAILYRHSSSRSL